eukprot:403355301
MVDPWGLLRVFDPKMQPQSIVQILTKLSNIRYKNKDEIKKILASKEFKEIASNVSTIYEFLSDSNKLSVLNAYLRLKYRDADLMNKNCTLVLQNKIRNPNTITNMLYVLAKFKFVPRSPKHMNKQIKNEDGTQSEVQEVNPFMQKCVDVLMRENALTVSQASRNLWNFTALKHYDKQLFTKFGELLVLQYDNMNEKDVASVIHAFSEFDHVQYEVIESVMKLTIRHISDWKLQSLAVIANSLSKLEIKNPTVFNILKQHLLNKANPESTDQDFLDLSTLDCAQFLTAFARVELFDFELFEALERVFLQQIDQANGETLVTMYNAHASFAQDVVKQCLIDKKQVRRFWTLFKKYNEEFNEVMIQQLTVRVEDINIKGVFLVLAHGNMAHLKKRDNMRLMHQFSLKALESLQEELKRLPKQHSQDYQLRIVFNFYQYSLKYCLNAQMKQDLITKMSECTGVDMVQLIQEQETTYLGGSLFQEEDKNNTKSSKSDGIKDAKIPNLQEIDEQNRLIKEFEKEKYGETNKARREMLAGVQDEDEFDEEEVESGDKKDKGQRNVLSQELREEMLKISKEQQTTQQSQTVDQ